MDREILGQIVRSAWVEWAKEQPQPQLHPSWLVSWEELSEADKEADRRIGEAVVREMRMIGFSAFISLGGMELEQRVKELEDQLKRTAARLEDNQKRIEVLCAKRAG